MKRHTHCFTFPRVEYQWQGRGTDVDERGGTTFTRGNINTTDVAFR